MREKLVKLELLRSSYRFKVERDESLIGDLLSAIFVVFAKGEGVMAAGIRAWFGVLRS